MSRDSHRILRGALSALCGAGALAATRDAHADDRVYLQLEGGGSVFATSPQSTQFGAGAHGGGRIGVRLAGPLGLHLLGGVGYWPGRTGQIDPNTGAQTAAGTLGTVGVGLRLAPQLSASLGHLYLDLDAGVGFTGGNTQQPYLGLGVGWNIPLSAALSLGPVVRYHQVVSSDAQLGDARFVTFGVAMAVPSSVGGEASGNAPSRLYMQLEGGGSAFVSAPQSQQFGVGVYGAARIGLRLAGPIGLHATGGYSYWAGLVGKIDPNTGTQTAAGHLATFGGGLRVAPEISPALGNVYVDLEASAGLTGSNFRQPVLGVGIGWNLPIGDGVAVGPVLRYAQALTRSDQVADARMFTFGVAMSVPGLFPSGRAGTGRTRAPVRLYAQLEVGGAFLLSAPQSDQFAPGFAAGGRVGAMLAGPLGVHLAGTYGYWTALAGQIDRNTGAQSQAGTLGVVAAGVRLAPEVSRELGRVYLDLEAGVGFTGANFQQPVLGIGLGWNIPVGEWLAVGPVIRYMQVLTDSTQVADARILTAGVSLALPGARRVEAPPTATDLDRDGVYEPDDVCPTVPRGAHPDPRRMGCPLEDRDHDGVFEPADQCPDVPAGATPDPGRAGCPLEDRDGDRVPDVTDECAAVPMGDHPDPARRGCPLEDRDHDGVFEPADQCPDEPQGNTPDAARPGCPAHVPAAVIVAGRIDINESVYFDTDRATIQARSYAILDSVARAMSEHTEITGVRVEGHTDDQGRARHNMSLSRHRAEAVVAYLTSRGVGEDRLSAQGYGATRPAVQGTSEEARAANRRVVFVITGGPSAQAEAADEGGHHGHHGHHGGGHHGHHGHHGH